MTEKVNFFSKLVAYFRMSKVERMIRGIDKDLLSFFVENWSSFVFSAGCVGVAYIFVVMKIDKFLFALVFLIFFIVVLVTNRAYRRYVLHLVKTFIETMRKNLKLFVQIISKLYKDLVSIYAKSKSFFERILFWIFVPIIVILFPLFSFIVFSVAIVIMVLIGVITLALINEFFAIIISSLLLNFISIDYISIPLSFIISLVFVLYGRELYNFDIKEVGNPFIPTEEFKKNFSICGMKDEIVLYRDQINKNRFFVKYQHLSTIQEFIQVEKSERVLIERKRKMEKSGFFKKMK